MQNEYVSYDLKLKYSSQRMICLKLMKMES